MPAEEVIFGVDQLSEQSTAYANLRIGLVTNHSATTSWGELSRLTLLRKGFNIVRLFSPEHGMSAQGIDGAFQPDTTDPSTGLTVVSLYGNHLIPTAKDLDTIDLLVFDIPDVGCRFYTYLWTMTYVMEACLLYNKPLLVLDRPNPIGGDITVSEGPFLDELNCASFIGRWSIPIRHSCTLGELATYFAIKRFPGLDLRVLKLKNWKRKQNANESGWHFVPPSPAITDIETALLYPGMGLLEGINVNEGRGTAQPFKQCGAPWINALELQEAVNSWMQPAMQSEPCIYTPSSGMFANEICNGLLMRIENASVLQPVQTGLKLIQTIISLYPDHCHERLYLTRANPTGKNHLDRLTGMHHSFEKIKNGGWVELHSVNHQWQEIMEPFLLY